jgi:hypothetical protein
MSNDSILPEQVRCALSSSKGGVLGLVDELLAASIKHDLLLAWEAGHCYVSFPNGGPVDRVDVPMPKSVFRAVLARIAVLCNEQNPNSVSAWAGQGQVAADSDSAKAIGVVFVNTPEKQSLELGVVRLRADHRDMGALAADVEECS